MTTSLKACLNGARRPEEHPALPVTPQELAADAREAAAAGVFAVHVHPRGSDGRESVEPQVIGAAVDAIRAAVPGLPVGVSTGAWIEPDPDRMLRLVESWTVRPDFASVNLNQPGAEQLAHTLLDLGIGVEAGLWTAADAEALIATDLPKRCMRVLVEPMDAEPADAVATAHAILDVLNAADVTAPKLLHGVGGAAWPVLDAARDLGLSTRMGLEDTVYGPDGTTAADNAELLRAARQRILAA